MEVGLGFFYVCGRLKLYKEGDGSFLHVEGVFLGAVGNARESFGIAALSIVSKGA